jgi:hypothetical protein
MAKPSNYIDGSVTGGHVPSDAKIRSNLILSRSNPDTLQVNTRLEMTQFTPATALGGATVNVPTNLLGVDFGGTYNHRLDNKDDWGIISSFGSDSDVPFNSINELDFQVTALYHDLIDPLHSWFFLINYSISRPFLPGIPLPGAGYLIINPENRTQIFIGIPFFAAWQFSPRWNAMFTYFIPYTVSSELDYHVTAQLKVFSKFEWYTQSWLRAFRPDNLNRIIFEQKRVTLGLSQPLGDDYFINFYGGFAFDQQVYEAHSQTASGITSQFLPAGVLGQIELAKTF